jgi:hypothetical protein
MIPLFDSLYQCIEILVVGRVVEDRPMKYFRMIANMSSSLCINIVSMAYPLSSVSTSKGFDKFGSTKIGA